MYCNECGKEVNENLKFCENCGNEIENEYSNNEDKKIKFKVADVVNEKNVLKCSNKVAYIASGWALKVRKRGIDLGIIIGFICFFAAMIMSANASDYNGQDSTKIFFLTFGTGILYATITVIVFNTISFIIRMGAEVIQLLDDIKNK